MPPAEEQSLVVLQLGLLDVRLYEVEEAEWICNAYAEQGSTLPKQTYEELRARHRAPSGTDQSAE